MSYSCDCPRFVQECCLCFSHLCKCRTPTLDESVSTDALMLPQASVPEWPSKLCGWLSPYFDEGFVSEDQRKAAKYIDIALTKIEMPQMYMAKILALMIMSVWALIMLLGSVYRIGTDDGTYTDFYTNWCFMMGAVTYILILFSALEWTGRLYYYILYGWWWVYFANAGLVFWLVNFILYETPQLVTDEGEKFGYGKVLVVERIIHVFPYVFAIGVTALLSPDIQSVLSCFPWKKGLRWRFVLYIFAVYVMAHLPFLAYISHYDFQKVYSVDYPMWFGIVAIEIFGMAHVVIPILILSPAFDSFRRNIYTKHSVQMKS